MQTTVVLIVNTHLFITHLFIKYFSVFFFGFHHRNHTAFVSWKVVFWLLSSLKWALYEFYLPGASHLFYIGFKSAIGVIYIKLHLMVRSDKRNRKLRSLELWISNSYNVLRRDALMTMGNTLGIFVNDSWDY